jgi:4-hydroxybenzoate polyprenyltransferase
MNLKPYIQIARPDHWFKNIFVLPGIVLAFFFERLPFSVSLGIDILIGLVCACLIASSNYVLNEILDAPKDLFHPEKRLRPIPSGQVKLPLAWLEWILLAGIGLGLAFHLNWQFGVVATLLWLAGCAYNIPPVRTKDLPYADVISESFNNPLRMAMGWYCVGIVALPPISILLAYWMFGAFLMATKRFAEYRMIDDPERAGQYRKSFIWYNEERLVESIFFYGALFGMFSGVFIARYQVELVLATPLVAYLMAYYLHLGFKSNSVVQKPEYLYREKKLVVLSLLAFAACAVLLLVNIDDFSSIFKPTQQSQGVSVTAPADAD